MKIPMVDLKNQYLKLKTEIDNNIKEVIENTDFINGEQVKLLQRELSEYQSVRHCITCANGTDALQVALMSLDLNAGDELITSDFTFIATVEAISLLKLNPVLIDVNKDTYNIDTEQIRKKITSKTKAIVPVHLFGQCADMDKIMDIAKEYNLYVIEDAAQALGSDYYCEDGVRKRAGTIGDIGCTSFFPSKNLGCYGDGGAIFTNNDELAEKIRCITNHGSKIKYQHDIIGVNSRLDSIQAAILRAKLPHLDNFIEKRRKVAEFYDKKFSNNPHIIIPKRSDFSYHTFHQYSIVLTDIDRDYVQQKLAGKNIASAIYYPIPCHKQKAFNYKFTENEFINADFLSENILSLPIHTEMTEEILEYITCSLLEIV